MSNKEQLQTNNTNLDALIARVNAAKDIAASLPEAGGGAGSQSNYTINIANELDHILYVNGVACEPGTTVNNIPANDYTISYYIPLDNEEVASTYVMNVFINDDGFSAYYDMIFDIWGASICNGHEEFEKCRSVNSMVYFWGSYVVIGMVIEPPWDYDNDIPVSNATISFEKRY